MDYAFKVEIVLDDQKILADQIYELDDVYKCIREMFTKKGMHDISKGNERLIFISKKGENDAFCTCGLNVNRLYDSEWASPYLKELLWYNGNKDTVENVLVIRAEYDRKYRK